MVREPAKWLVGRGRGGGGTPSRKDTLWNGWHVKRNMMAMDAPALSRANILATLDAHADELRRMGARSLALFGSLARGEGTDSSDIDLLVELQPKTFDAYMDVKLFLERILGRRVDLVLADAVKPRLRSVILAEAVHASRL